MSVYLCNYLIFNVLQFVKKQISFFFSKILSTFAAEEKNLLTIFFIL